jgi:hypothetical protein
METKYCEECGTKMWKNKEQILANGSVSFCYYCKKCETHITFYDKTNEVEKRPLPQGPKILHIDIETAPIKAFVWGLWKNNVSLNQIETDWYVLTWVAKWHRAEHLEEDALPFHEETYKKDPQNDKALLETLWPLLDEADIVVAHNGDKFDLPKLNARFIYHGIAPPSPYKTVDTLKVAKYTFRFTSNKLQYLANFLGFGGKEQTGGQQLWTDCIEGIQEAWDTMVTYNRKDVQLLEDVYTVMRPWIRNHPNFGVYSDENYSMCTVCGSPEIDNLTESEDKYAYTNLGKFELYKCTDCGKYIRGRSSVLDKVKKKFLVTNAL